MTGKIACAIFSFWTASRLYRTYMVVNDMKYSYERYADALQPSLFIAPLGLIVAFAPFRSQRSVKLPNSSSLAALRLCTFLTFRSLILTMAFRSLASQALRLDESLIH